MKLVDFDVYADLLREKSGLVLTQEKMYLIESRLSPIAKKWNFNSLEALTMELQAVPDKKLVEDVVEAMTPNETSFFRDMKPFENFENHVLPYLLQSRIHKRKFRIWCAAASTGQEPYSLAMIIKKHDSEFSHWKNEIIATDIARSVLDYAKAGLYSQFEVQRGLPVQLLMEHFKQEKDGRWQISDSLRKMVTYQSFNLLDSMAALGQFEVIFCRNVLIYFDEKTKSDILNRMAKALHDDGFLFLGGAETVIGLSDEFVPLPDIRGVYVKKNSLHLQK
jgi:chemotaxis protein methyltransferase CheR